MCAVCHATCDTSHHVVRRQRAQCSDKWYGAGFTNEFGFPLPPHNMAARASHKVSTARRPASALGTALKPAGTGGSKTKRRPLLPKCGHLVALWHQLPARSTAACRRGLVVGCRHVAASGCVHGRLYHAGTPARALQAGFDRC